MINRTAVITGIGIATSVAVGKEAFKKALFSNNIENKISIDELSKTAEQLFSYEICRRMDTFSKYGVIAAKLAFEDAGLHTVSLDKTKMGGILSTVWGPIVTTHSYFKDVLLKGPASASPFLFPYTVTNAVTGAVARLLGLAGVSSMLVGSCPINYSYDLIKCGKADIIIAGGVENVASFFDVELNSKDKNTLEGACLVVMEEKENARKRGAKILAEIKGYTTGNITVSFDQKDFKSGLCDKLTNLFNITGIQCNEVDMVISMLGGYDKYNGLAEDERDLIEEIFGKSKNIPELFRIKDLNNLFGLQSPLNLCLSLFLIENKRSQTNGISGNSANVKLGSKKIHILSNSLIYGGNFNSILISE
ncbi:MAG: hypothetical protein K6U80_14030 [Firmicutes bacterium]|nr:hypothetical protein [Bacillota bacterium]